MNHKRKRRTVKRVRCQFCKRTGHKGRSHENDPHPGHPRSVRERAILAEPIAEIAEELIRARATGEDYPYEFIVDDPRERMHPLEMGTS